MIQDYDFLAKKYSKYIGDKNDTGGYLLGDIINKKDLYDYKSASLKIMGQRVRQDFFTIANQVQKRVSFYGIFRSTDKIEITRRKLKKLRTQINRNTSFLVQELKMLNDQIDRRQTEEEIKRYK